MCQTNSQITVLFDDPFWVLIYEKSMYKSYEVCKVTFGAEPKDYDVYAFLLSNFSKLKFVASLSQEIALNSRKNPKRMQREIRKMILQKGIGTKAQRALAKEREQNKKERKANKKEQKEIEQKKRYEQYQKKKREKHRGH